MQDQRDLEMMLRSHTPIIVIESHEERRVLDLFRKLAPDLGLPVSKWTVTRGLMRLVRGSLPQKFNSQPQDVIGHIRSCNAPGIWIMCDFHPYLEDPVMVRMIREIAQNHAGMPHHLVFLSPKFEIPTELRNMSARFALRLPDREKVVAIIKEVASDWMHQTGRKVVADKKAVTLLARNLSGLTFTDCRRLARKAVFDDGAIDGGDLDRVTAAKYELLSQDGVLTFEYETADFAEVGGLANLKQWLHLRRAVFHGGGEAYGLEAPKGMLLLGVQGCGKSLAAKAVAGVWSVPLLRLDFATLYNKYIGETERNLRESLKTAEIMAPCVLWVDEIEKGLGGNSGDDGGVSKRILGTLLTWMSEKKAAVFVVATANDVSALPPELLRKGRFDELFFVDLPDAPNRQEIFRIQLEKRKLNPEDFDLSQLAEATRGFSGSEIEQAVVAALYQALAVNAPVGTAHILGEVQTTRPLSVLMAEKINWLRDWASERTVPAG